MVAEVAAGSAVDGLSRGDSGEARDFFGRKELAARCREAGELAAGKQEIFSGGGRACGALPGGGGACGREVGRKRGGKPVERRR